MKEIWGAIIITILLITGTLFLSNSFKNYSCNERWKSSTFKSKYSFVTGCLIETKPGLWIPASSYREIQ